MYTRLANNRGFNLIELMLSVVCSVFLLAGVCVFYNAAGQDYNASIFAQNLQNGANVIISKITEGETETISGVTSVYRLSTASAYLIPNGSAGYLYTCGGGSTATSCNSISTSGEIYFCQDSPCTSSDSTARWYYLNSTSTSVMYHYPGEPGNNDITIYTAPSNSTISLRFSPAFSNVVEIDADLIKTVSAKYTNSRIKNTSANLSTYVLLRNH
jgi:hypothetical protein